MALKFQEKVSFPHFSFTFLTVPNPFFENEFHWDKEQTKEVKGEIVLILLPVIFILFYRTYKWR